MEKTDHNLPPQFNGILSKGEDILWSGQPHLWPFVLTGVPFLLLGLAWGTFDYSFLKSMHHSGKSELFIYPFFILHSFPCWGSIANIVRLFLVRNNTFYAITDKRFMLRGGLWGTSFKTIEYDQVKEINVNVGPIQNMMGVGTISIDTGRTKPQGLQNMGNFFGFPQGDDAFVGVSNPYEVFKISKQTSQDIKADINFPNAKRPNNNPGYKTKYNPQMARKTKKARGN